MYPHISLTLLSIKTCLSLVERHSYTKSRNSVRIKLQSLQRTSRISTFKYKEHLKKNHSNHPSRSQSSLESSSKASRNSKRLQISEALRIQASKSRRTFTTNLWRRIYEKRKIYNKLIAKDSSQFRSKDLSSHFPIKVRTSCVWIKTNIDTILELMTFLRRLNQMTIILYYNLNTLNCTYKFINTKIHWWNYFDCLISKLEILYLQ